MPADKSTRGSVVPETSPGMTTELCSARKDGGDRPPSARLSMHSTRSLLSVNEQILEECHRLYTDKDKGLCSISKAVDQQVLAPRKKIIVLLIGNHSAGKSSYINWYIDDRIQGTGVAIETQGFTFVTSGRKRESLRGPATLQTFPRFQGLSGIQGVEKYLRTEVSTSKEKRFPMVTFIDTPGLVDGEMHYPFDLNRAILWFGNHADLIFVFFDPIGQALCKRTMTLVEELNGKHADKMHFYLSKADEAGDETDRQSVMMQIVQELCKRPDLNRAGFKMPTIYIPNLAKVSRCTNQIESTCTDIENTINHSVQHGLNSLGTDAEMLCQRIGQKLDLDKELSVQNRNASLKRAGSGILAIVIIAIVLINLIVIPSTKLLINNVLGENMARMINGIIEPVRSVWSIIPEDWHILSAISTLVVTVGLVMTLFSRNSPKPRMSRKQRRNLKDSLEHLECHVIPEKRRLYQQYIDDSVGSNAN